MMKNMLIRCPLMTYRDIWAQKDIERLVDKGIILTDESGEEYMPDKYLTRIEMIRYVLRWLDLCSDRLSLKLNPLRMWTII